VTREEWEQQVGALLSGGEVGDLLGHASHDRVDELLRARLLIELVDSSGQRCYPAFQFRDGQPVTDVIDAFWLVRATITDWSAAAWCTSPDPALGDRTPAQFAAAGGDREQLMTLARRDAARLAQ